MSMTKFWQCKYCGIEGTGPRLKAHNRKCEQEHLARTPSASTAGPSRSLILTVGEEEPLNEEEETWLHSASRASPSSNSTLQPPSSPLSVDGVLDTTPILAAAPDQPVAAPPDASPAVNNSSLDPATPPAAPEDTQSRRLTQHDTNDSEVPDLLSQPLPLECSANTSARESASQDSVMAGFFESSAIGEHSPTRNLDEALSQTATEDHFAIGSLGESTSRASDLGGSLERSAQQGGSRNPQVVLDRSSELVEDEESLSTPEPVGRREESFALLWCDAFLGCQSMSDLDEVIARCTADWLRKASARVGDSQPSERPQRRNPQPSRQRQQSRQLQRIRQNNNRRADEARRIQSLFRVYPKRAVRRVLGEKSPAYTGTKEEATNFLRRTYVRPPLDDLQCNRARRLFDACNWSLPSQDQIDYLNRPPSREEIQMKLRKATNTAPGEDGLEYRHLRSLDPLGLLLEAIYATVWRIGIPTAWRKSRTFPIYKKGETSDYSNFRPISLLSTLYKLLSGVLSHRMTEVSSSLGWLSPEQKGFLPGVRGIQEHTQLLQTVVEEATFKRRNLSVAWLDLCNAFRSIPHLVLIELFNSLPIPDDLRRLLLDCYEGNLMDFRVSEDTVTIAPTAGVRQGDALSSTVFNLAAEPLLRAAKSASNSGFFLLGHTVKATAYADDIAVISSTAQGLQETLDHLSEVSAVLGLKFNAGKCSSLNFLAGKPFLAKLDIEGGEIRSLGPHDQETYLGIPIGARLRFRPATELLSHLDKLAESLLAPWQKLEVYRSHLLPSLSHSLASGRVEKEFLAKLDTECRKFLGQIAEVPNEAVTEFYYADRRVGGLGTCRLSEDADIWTLARATQLLTSSDPLVRGIFKEQLLENVRRGFTQGVPEVLPVAEFLSGSVDHGLYRLRFAPKSKETLWTLARRAAKRQRVRIDISGDESYFLVADDVSVRPLKAVRGLRQVIRQRNTKRFCDVNLHPHQGRVASALALESSSKDMARLISCRTELRYEDWKYLHRARLDLLQLRGYFWSKCQDKTCRHCGQTDENGFHVINNCQVHLLEYTRRHDSVLDLFYQLLLRKGYTANINRAMPGQRLRPDVEMSVNGSRLMVDVAVSYDTPENLDAAFNRKVGKYQSFGKILPLVVGSLGSWYPRNNDIRSLLGIDGRSWNMFRKKARMLAFHGSLAVIRKHLGISHQHILHDAHDPQVHISHLSHE